MAHSRKPVVFAHTIVKTMKWLTVPLSCCCQPIVLQHHDRRIVWYFNYWRVSLLFLLIGAHML